MSVDDATLFKMAQKLRRHSIESTTEAGSGHPTTCMSCADLLSVLFFDEMRWDPNDPSGKDADVFVLSKGHAAPILWAVLKEAGAIKENLLDLRKFDSPLEGHPTRNSPWVRVATGSLGQGICAAAGMAWTRKLDQTPARVYALLGDGEVAEGSVWEAAQFASQYKLDNLVAIVDVNRLGQSAPTMLQHDTGAYARRFAAFGFEVVEVDGHNIGQIKAAYAKARATTGKPFAVIAKTFKGKGVSFLEDKDGWHGKPLKKGEETQKAIAELGDTNVSIKVEARKYPASKAPAPVTPSLTPEYELGQEVATREAYGTGLAKLAKTTPQVVAIDADTKNSTFTERFMKAAPERYAEAFIAEQNMIGAALGMATEGKIPFAATFACFLSRGYDFIRMAAHSKPDHLILAGSHAGVSIGEDGPSQMALEDLAMMRGVIGSTVLYPSEAVSAERLLETAAKTKGLVYIRTTRPKTKVLYKNDEPFPVGGSKTLRSSAKDAVTIVGAGITVPEALAAADQLAKDGITVRVIDLYSVKPIDTATLQKAAAETKGFVTVEDHGIHGGIGEAVASAVTGRAKVVMLGIREMPRSGQPRELMEKFGIASDSIVKAVRELI
jgi:transketolase